jgi:hypothetical protein
MEGTSSIINVLFKILPGAVRFFSRSYRNSRKLIGTWNYECILKTGIFTDEHSDGIERNAHGGECTIEIESSLMTTKISIKGTRTWAANIDEQGNKNDFYRLAHERPWESNDAAFITDNRIMYKYSIDNSLAGITFMDIIYERNAKRIRPRGEFFYLPDERKKYKNVKTFDRILATKSEPFSQITLKASGNIRFFREG